MTGRNAALADSIRTRFTADPRVTTVPFSEQLPKYMDASDVILTKPDVISLTETGVKGLPFVSSVPVTEKEKSTVSFFAERDMCIIPESFDQIVDEAIRIGQNEVLHDERFILLRKNIPQKATEKIVSTVCSMLQVPEDQE